MFGIRNFPIGYEILDQFKRQKNPSFIFVVVISSHILSLRVVRFYANANLQRTFELRKKSTCDSEKQAKSTGVASKPLEEFCPYYKWPEIRTFGLLTRRRILYDLEFL